MHTIVTSDDVFRNHFLTEKHLQKVDHEYNIKMWQLLFLLFTSLPSMVQSLEPFDPWLTNNGACESSMTSCTFHLHASNAMTMFYKELFRVIATNDGILQKYDDSNKTFDFDNILTGDGYPKLVRDIYIHRKCMNMLKVIFFVR